MNEDQKLMIKATAALDQYWESLELLYPFMCELATGIPSNPSSEQREIARICCQVVSWELSVRSLRNLRQLKCQVELHDDDALMSKTDALVEINTISGMKKLWVAASKLDSVEGDHIINVQSWKQPDGSFLIYLPPVEGRSKALSFSVAETEIIFN